MNINKTILITGASKNLGNYLTQHYQKKNFNVIGVSKTTKSLINKNFYLCDLSNAKKTNFLFEKLKKKK
jgi:short-subunit dehydrogenase